MFSSAKKRFILLESAVAVVLLGAFWFGHQYLWWFSGAYAQRQTAQAFFSAVATGNDQAAYKLTSANLQQTTPFAQFSDDFKGLENSGISVTYQSYSHSRQLVTVSGVMTNPKTGHKFSFGFKYQAPNLGQIDAITFNRI